MSAKLLYSKKVWKDFMILKNKFDAFLDLKSTHIRRIAAWMCSLKFIFGLVLSNEL